MQSAVVVAAASAANSAEQTNQTLQDRLSEELALLPGRVSRTFYLLASLDAQASFVKNDLKRSRIEALESLKSLQPSTTSTAAPSNNNRTPSSALLQLRQAERRLLADKLLVNKKALEWLVRAKTVADQCQKESRKRTRTSTSYGQQFSVHSFDQKSTSLTPTGGGTDNEQQATFISSRPSRRSNFASLFSEIDGGAAAATTMLPDNLDYSQNVFPSRIHNLRLVTGADYSSSGSAIGEQTKRRRIGAAADVSGSSSAVGVSPGKPARRSGKCGIERDREGNRLCLFVCLCPCLKSKSMYVLHRDSVSF